MYRARLLDVHARLSNMSVCASNLTAALILVSIGVWEVRGSLQFNEAEWYRAQSCAMDSVALGLAMAALGWCEDGAQSSDRTFQLLVLLGFTVLLGLKPGHV
jgi:hypothetical protein